MLAGEGASISLIVENRRSKQSKTFTFGTEIVFIISEERAKFGTKDIIEELLRTPEVNINAAVAICKGKSEDLFSLKAETDTISEQLFEMLKFSYEGNFYSKCNSINDFLVMYHQQGREVYLPYIEIGVDCLDLGKYAIAKYGRDSGYDSHEKFSNADIQVHVNVKIKSTGKIHGSSVEDES